MNAGIGPDHPAIHYYDSDYPSPQGIYPENFDEVTEYQGLAFDLQRYESLAAETGGPILELCCGTGRVAIPLARAGHDVTAVDVSSGMLEQLRSALSREDRVVAQRVHPVEQDITTLNLRGQLFRMGILAFNSLLCITDFESQCRALEAAFRHLLPRGVLVLDVVNPTKLKIDGDPVPRPFFTRRSPHTGHRYTRFAMMSPFDAGQKQRLYGWYDEVCEDGVVKRREYSLFWRPIFRFELELMLRRAGFVVINLEGGHKKEPFTADSDRMLIQAFKPE